MMLKRFTPPALALCLGITGLATVSAHGANPALPTPGIGQERGGWDAPPQELGDIQRRGFHDGVEAARDDLANRRRPVAEYRDEFRHPRVQREFREQYRDGFRRGYQLAVSRQMGDHDRQMGEPDRQMREPDRGGWDAPPGEFNEIQRRGFHDGMEEARKDLERHRQLDVERHDQFRRPGVSRELRDAYREGFRRGYQTALSHQGGDRDRR